MPTYAATIFLSAFLLFLVQPIIAKQILPWFGGSASVWATCMVFFQAALLAGYGYAHLLVRRQANRPLVSLHLALLVLSLLALPIVPSAHWQPSGAELPSLLILMLLIPTIGLPYFLLATTSPLLQAWVAAQFPHKNPYRLFALSNLASLGALLSYPWAIEPWLTTSVQARGWSIAYALYVVCAAWLTLAAMLRGAQQLRPALNASADAPTIAPARREIVRWTALAALASFMLLAVTNHLTQNIPSVPMMWVVPLTIYLATFVLCFEGRGWYRRTPFTIFGIAAVALMVWMLIDKTQAFALVRQSAVFLCGLFAVCMLCHGELALSKPTTSHLTTFYFSISLGGVLGGSLVGLGAPLMLSGYFEIEIGLIATALLLASLLRGAGRLPIAIGVLVVAATAGCAAYNISEQRDNLIAATRSFYGVLRVEERGSAQEPTSHVRTLMHGPIAHGDQMRSPPLRTRPTSYYTETSGVGLLLTRAQAKPLRVGVIGLGAGTLAAYGRPGDVYRFFEIDPGVLSMAQRHFTFLQDSAASVHTVIGDGRLSLGREPDSTFDVLVVDAFSGDSIPMHLITVEALTLYLKKVSQDGVIAFHLSNKYLNLLPIMLRLAREMDLELIYVKDVADEDEKASSTNMRAKSDWVLLARSEPALDDERIHDRATATAEPPGTPLWTDDHNNILQALELR